MPEQTLKFSFSYGKFRYFEFSDGTGKVDLEFSWDTPAQGPGGAALPKAVAELFDANVRGAIQKIIKGEETAVRAIRQQLRAWDQKIERHEIPGQELFRFVNLINETLEQRARDRFAAAGGTAAVMALIRKQAVDGLDKAVRDWLNRSRWAVQVKATGKALVAVTAVGLSIAATVATGGAALPLVVAAGKAAYDLAREGKAAYDSFQAGADEVTAVVQALERHRNASAAAMATVERAEARRYLMAEAVQRQEALCKTVRQKYQQVSRLLDQKKIDGVTITDDPAILGLANSVRGCLARLDQLEEALDASRARLAEVDGLIGDARSAFDPRLLGRIPKADWQGRLKQFADTYGQTGRQIADIGAGLCKLVEKMA